MNTYLNLNIKIVTVIVERKRKIWKKKKKIIKKEKNGRDVYGNVAVAIFDFARPYLVSKILFTAPPNYNLKSIVYNT